jgi:hypothetical protein
MQSHSLALTTLSEIVSESLRPALSPKLFSPKNVSQFLLSLKAVLNAEFAKNADSSKEEKHLVAARIRSFTPVIDFINLNVSASLTADDWHVLSKFFAEHQNFINDLNADVLPKVQRQVAEELTQQHKKFYMDKKIRNYAEFPAHLADIFSQNDLESISRSYLEMFLNDVKTLDNGAKIIFDAKLCKVIACLQAYLSLNGFNQFIEALGKYISGLKTNSKVPCQKLINLVNLLTGDQLLTVYHLIPDLSEETELQFGSDYIPLIEFLDAVLKANKKIDVGEEVSERIYQNYIYYKTHYTGAHAQNQAHKLIRVAKYFSKPVSDETLKSLVNILLQPQIINVYIDNGDGEELEAEEMHANIPDFETLASLFDKLTFELKTLVARTFIETPGIRDIDMDFDPAIFQPYIVIESYFNANNAYQRSTNLQDDDDAEENDLSSLQELGFYLPLVSDLCKYTHIKQLFKGLDFENADIHCVAYTTIIPNLDTILRLVPVGCMEKLISYASKHPFPSIFEVREWHQHVTNKNMWNELLDAVMKIYYSRAENLFGFTAPFALITCDERLPEVLKFLCNKLDTTLARTDKQEIIKRLSEFEKIPDEKLQILVIKSIKRYVKEFMISDDTPMLLKIAYNLNNSSLQKSLADFIYSIVDSSLQDDDKLKVFSRNFDTLMAIYESTMRKDIRVIILKTFLASIKINQDNDSFKFSLDELDQLIPDQSMDEITEACKYLLEQMAKPISSEARYVMYDCLILFLPYLPKAERMKLVTQIPNANPIQQYIYLAANKVDTRHSVVTELTSLPPEVTDIVIAYDNYIQPTF